MLMSPDITVWGNARHICAAGAPANFNLTWSTIPGQTYQAQFNTNLTQTNWMNLGGPFTATNSSFTTSNPTSSNAQTFYRVVITP